MEINSINDSLNIVRSERSNLITTLCLDLEIDNWIVKTIDLREPLERFIPIWIVEEILKGNNNEENNM